MCRVHIHVKVTPMCKVHIHVKMKHTLHARVECEYRIIQYGTNTLIPS